MKIYRLVLYHLKIVLYPMLFPIMLKNITQHHINYNLTMSTVCQDDLI